mgnify:FL=1
MLAADLACWVEPPSDEIGDVAQPNFDAASADLVHAADAGSTFSSAVDLGPLDGSNRYNGSVGGHDRSDVMKFTITGEADVTVALTGLSSDIDLYLCNSSGQRIGTSNASRSASESISQALDAGDYYVLVAPWRFARSRYVLSIDVVPTANPPTTTDPDEPAASPSEPTEPTGPVTAYPDVAYYGGSNDWNLNAINAPEVWAQGYTGSGVTVAVVDTGVDLDHPKLTNQIWVNPGGITGNGIDDDQDGYVDDVNGWDFASNDNRPDDGNGHGTHVAGTIAADANGVGATGVAPDATIMPVRVLNNNGSGTLSAVAAGIRYAAANGADIINLSLGGGFSSVIHSALQYAQQLGVLVVAAAGNEYSSTPSYPARFSAALNNVISVGAHNSSNRIANFSNDVGGSGAVQIDAPGVSVYSAYHGNRYARLSGTSMATPHVAAMAALALSANPSLTATQLRSAIVNGSDRTVSGSDSNGGINAALTVALAAAGDVSSGTTTASDTQTLTTSQFAFSRWSARSVANPVDAPTLASFNTFTPRTAQIESARTAAAPAATTIRPPASSALQASAIDEAIASLLLARSSDGDDEADDTAGDRWCARADHDSVLSFADV